MDKLGKDQGQYNNIDHKKNNKKDLKEKNKIHQSQMEFMEKQEARSEGMSEDVFARLYSLVDGSENLKKLFNEIGAEKGIDSSSWESYNQLLTEDRKEKMKSVLDNRTSFIRVAIQDIYHKHNISACLRSCEAFGILNVDIISTTGKFKASTASKGVERWMNVENYGSVKKYCDLMHEQGYKIAAAYPPHYDVVDLSEIPLDNKLVIAFGNEHYGLSEDWSNYVDLKYSIPMYGMVESLNISVSCGISLNYLVSKARKLVEKDLYFLSKEEKEKIMDSWIKKHFSWIK